MAEVSSAPAPSAPAPSAPAPAPTAPSPQPMDLPMAPTQAPEPSTSVQTAPAPSTAAAEPTPTGTKNTPVLVSQPAPEPRQQNPQTQTQWSSYVPPPPERAPKPAQTPTPTAPEPEPLGQSEGRYGYGPTATDIFGSEFSTTPSEPYQQCEGECIAKGFSQQCKSGEREWHSPRYAEGTRQEYEDTVIAGADEALKRGEEEKARQQAQQQEAETTKKRTAEIKDEQLYQAHHVTAQRQQNQQQTNQQSTTQVAERDRLEQIAQMPIDPAGDHDKREESKAVLTPQNQGAKTPSAPNAQQVAEPTKQSHANSEALRGIEPAVGKTPAHTIGPEHADRPAPQSEKRSDPAVDQAAMLERVKANQDKRWASQSQINTQLNGSDPALHAYIPTSKEDDRKLAKLAGQAEHDLGHPPRNLGTVSYDEIDRRLKGISSHDHTQPRVKHNQPHAEPQKVTHPSESQPEGLTPQPDATAAQQAAYRNAAGQREETPKRRTQTENNEPSAPLSASERAYFADLREAERRRAERSESHLAQNSPSESGGQHHDAPRQSAKSQKGGGQPQQANPYADPQKRRQAPTDIHGPGPHPVPTEYRDQSFIPRGVREPRETWTRSALRWAGHTNLANRLDEADVVLADKDGRRPDRDTRTRYALSQSLHTNPERERTTIQRINGERVGTHTTQVSGQERGWTKRKQEAETRGMWKQKELPEGYERTSWWGWPEIHNPNEGRPLWYERHFPNFTHAARAAPKAIAKAAAKAFEKKRPQPAPTPEHAPEPSRSHWEAAQAGLKRAFQRPKDKVEAQTYSQPQASPRTQTQTPGGHYTMSAEYAESLKPKKATSEPNYSDDLATAYSGNATATQTATQTKTNGHPDGKIGFVDPKTYWSISGVTSKGKTRKAITTHRIGKNWSDCLYDECPYCSKEANILKGGSGRIGLPEVDSRGREERLSRMGYWVYRPDARTSHYADPTAGHLLEPEKGLKKSAGGGWKAFYYDTGETVYGNTREEALAKLSERGRANYQVDDLTNGGTGYGNSKAEAGENLFSGRSGKQRKGRGR